MNTIASAGCYGGTFAPSDRNNPRTIIGHWTPGNARVLDVGGGNGVISRWLKQTKHCYIIELEITPQAAQYTDAYDQIIIGNIESDGTIEQISRHAPFDTIIFADVLEHLVDPWRILRQVRPFLAPKGRVLLSVPNIAHWTARLSLLQGRFDYTDGYLMDRTHLRWFTWRSANEMARQAGYIVKDEGVVYKPRFVRLFPTLMGFQIVLNLAVA